MASQSSSQLFEWHFGDLNHSDFHIYSRGLLLLVLFFTLVLTVTFFFFYAHCSSFRARRLPFTATSTTVTNVVPPPESLGLDAATIGNLPVSLHRPVMIDNANVVVDIEAIEIECCICLGVLEAEEKVKVLPKCLHTYHSECVDKWLSVQSSCPLCRLSLKVINSL